MPAAGPEARNDGDLRHTWDQGPQRLPTNDHDRRPPMATTMGKSCEGTPDDHVHARCRATWKRRAVTPPLDIVGVDYSAEAEVAAKWAVREAELRLDDVLLVHAYEVPLLPSSSREAAIAQGRQERQDLLDKVAATLAVPPRMHLEQLIEITARSPCCHGCLSGPN